MESATVNILGPSDVMLVDLDRLAYDLSLNQKILLLDARSVMEYNTSHINGAVNVNQIELIHSLSKDITPSRLKLTCSSGRRLTVSSRTVLYFYDQCLDDLRDFRSDSLLSSLLSTVVTEIKPVFLLKGGFHAFKTQYPDLCWKNSQNVAPKVFWNEPLSGQNNRYDLNERTIAAAPTARPDSLSIYSSTDAATHEKEASKSLPVPKATWASAYSSTSFTPSLDIHRALSSTSYSPRTWSPCDNQGPSLVLPHVVLGCRSDAQSMILCREFRITHVLNVSVDLPRPAHIPISNFHRIPVLDNYTDCMVPYFADAFNFIDRAKSDDGCVLVHCAAGISRSPTVVIAYLMHTYQLSMQKAFDLVRSKRTTIAPNFNFLGQLLAFERTLNDSRTTSVDFIDTNPKKSDLPHSSPFILSSPNVPRVLTECGIPKSNFIVWKDSTRKKRERPKYLSLHPCVSTASDKPILQVGRNLCPTHDPTPEEGKRRRSTLVPCSNILASPSLLPSPSTIMSKLELGSPSEVHETPLPLVLNPPARNIDPPENFMATSHSNLSVISSSNIDVLFPTSHDDYSCPISTCHSCFSTSSVDQTLHPLSSTCPEVHIVMSSSSLLDACISLDYPATFNNIGFPSSIGLRSENVDSSPLSPRLACSAPASRLSSPIPFHSSPSVSAELVFTVNTDSARARVTALHSSHPRTTCKKQQHMTCKSSSTSSDSISSVSHNGSCYNWYPIS